MPNADETTGTRTTRGGGGIIAVECATQIDVIAAANVQMCTTNEIARPRFVVIIIVTNGSGVDAASRKLSESALGRSDRTGYMPTVLVGRDQNTQQCVVAC